MSLGRWYLPRSSQLRRRRWRQFSARGTWSSSAKKSSQKPRVYSLTAQAKSRKKIPPQTSWRWICQTAPRREPGKFMSRRISSSWMRLTGSFLRRMEWKNRKRKRASHWSHIFGRSCLCNWSTTPISTTSSKFRSRWKITSLMFRITFIILQLT